jgi:predicted acylesterase/phospholipase RssA/CRP-like cAMP-binding protein
VGDPGVDVDVQNHALDAGKLFEGLSDAAQRALRAELDLVLVRGGEVVVRQGEPSDALYVVIQGRLRVLREREDGTVTMLSELRRGQSVGEIGLLTGGARTATVAALRDSLLARLSRESFDRLVESHPLDIVRQFAGPVIKVLQDQINDPRRPQDEPATIAVVPLDDGSSTRALASRLARALSSSGPTLHLDAKHLPPGEPFAIEAVRWLSEQEAAHRYVVYEADPGPTAWSERCVRQADRILLVAGAGGTPEPHDLERALLPERDGRITAKRILVLLHPPQTERPSGTSRWLAGRRLDGHYHVRPDRTEDVARLARLVTGHGVGLVLSGGGATGFGHLGAVRALREAGVPIDLVGGTSQGGLMACQVAMGWDDAAMMAKNRAAIRHKFDYTFPITALMNGASMTHVVQEMFGDAQLEDMWIPCYCVTANISRAAMMVHDRGPVWKYARATTSIPGVLPPVIDGGEMLVDGGLLNNLPTDVMRQRGDCGTVIACDVTAALAGRASAAPAYETSVSGWKVLRRRLTPFASRIRVPTIAQIMMRVAVFGASQRADAARELADFCIPLDLRGYGLLEFKKLDEIVEAGYRSARGIVATWGDVRV